MDEAAPPDESLDESYAAPALEKIRAAVRGNGAAEKDITLSGFSGQVYEFEALTRLEPAIKTYEKTIPGKKAIGQRADTPQAARDAIEKERAGMTSRPDIVQRIKNVFIERPDKGLGIRNLVVKLPFLTQEFSRFEQCRTCAARGEIQCNRCAGKGSESCPRCQGQGAEICTQCRGAQYIYDGNNKRQCPRCNGQGRTLCLTCNQTRKIQCAVCRGKGSMACQNCGGQGWNTHVTTAEMNVTANFDFDRANLPAEIAEGIEALGADLAARAHVTPYQKAQELNADAIVIDYILRLPAGKGEFSVRGASSFSLLLMGAPADIVNAPAFLEPLIAPGLKFLTQAAAGQGDGADFIRRAGKYRIIRQAILGTARYSKGKTAKALEKGNPIGLSAGLIKSMVQDADKAINNITAKPARIGLGIGILCAGVLYGAYLDSPARNMLAAHIPKPALKPAADIIVYALGVFAAALAARAFAAGAMNRALAELLPKGERKSILPKAGHNWLIAGGVCAVLFLLAAESAAHMQGLQAPEWYAQIRALVLKKL